MVQQRRSGGGEAHASEAVASGLVQHAVQRRSGGSDAARGQVVPSGLLGSGLQLRRGDGGESSGLVGHAHSVHAAAAHGVATSASSLPHLDAIQRSFGRHDVSAVQAHTGSEARASADAMGADAYATGNHVVLGRGTDLFTTAHEAAHVVQQRAGVQLKGGVGETGDAYERHADEVAAMVVQGKSAESLLDRYAGGGGAGPSSVQRMEASSSSAVLERPATPDSFHSAEGSPYHPRSPAGSEDEEFYDALDTLEPERSTESEIEVIDEHARPGQTGRHSRTPSDGVFVDVPLHDPVEPTAAAPAAAGGPGAMDYVKAASYLSAGVSTFASALGWILVRKFPTMQPITQSLSSGIRNGLSAVDEYRKGNTLKSAGNSMSATGQFINIASTISVAQTGKKKWNSLRSVGTAINGVGLGIGGDIERKKIIAARAKGEKPTGWFKSGAGFVGSAVSFAGTLGYALEATKSNSTAMLMFEGIYAFLLSVVPFGVAGDDLRASKDKYALIRDPKILGNALTSFAFIVNGIATNLNKIYLTKDAETGSKDAQQYAPLISALGATGMFMATVGYGISTYAALPKRPAAPKDDIEMAALPSTSAAPPAPAGGQVVEGDPPG